MFKFSLTIAIVIFLSTSLYALPKKCKKHSQCDDGIWCNGAERCVKKIDKFVCVRGAAQCRSTSLMCDEGAKRCANKAQCQSGRVDYDGDGHKSNACGGDDCDDNDINKYPGNVEVCDSQNHDEDCNTMTFGRKDVDQDGQTSNKCCNMTRTGLKCGKDCNDSNPMIMVGSQTCLRNEDVYVKICGANKTARCSSNLVCYVQPNGLGVCAP